MTTTMQFDEDAPQALPDEDGVLEARELDRDDLEALLPAYVKHRDAASTAEKAKEEIAAKLKTYFTDHPDAEIYDGEHRLKATFIEKNMPGVSYDLNALFDNDEVLFLQLLRNGCLRVNKDSVKLAGANVGGVSRYEFPAGKTRQLDVRAVK